MHSYSVDLGHQRLLHFAEGKRLISIHNDLIHRGLDKVHIYRAKHLLSQNIEHYFLHNFDFLHRVIDVGFLNELEVHLIDFPGNFVGIF